MYETWRSSAALVALLLISGCSLDSPHADPSTNDTRRGVRSNDARSSVTTTTLFSDLPTDHPRQTMPSPKVTTTTLVYSNTTISGGTAPANTTPANTTTTLPPLSPRPLITTTTSTKPPTVPSAPGNGQDLSAYPKISWVQDIPVVSSAAVSNQAHAELAGIVNGMLQLRPQLMNPYKTTAGFRFIIRGINERTLDLPDVTSRPYLREWVVSSGGDTRVGGGFGCTPTTPITVVSESNLLRRSDDPWRGESVALHEIAHLFLSCYPSGSFLARATAAYDSALRTGLWSNTYARANVQEYWAEGVQSYFNTNLQANPANGIHNYVNTRAELMTYDRALFELIDGYFGPNHPWVY